MNLDWSPWTGEPGKNREDKPEQDSNDRTRARAVDKVAGAGQLAHTAGAGQLGQDSQRKQSGYYVQDRIKKMRQPAHVSKNRVAGTGQGDGTTVAAQLA